MRQSSHAITSYEYESGTNRLLGVSLDREGYDGTDVAIRYGYDAAGNVTSMKDQPTADAVSGASLQDNQCFGYDGLRRLSVAWTAGDGDCAVAQGDIQTSDVGGVEPYWTEYEYDPLGNRTLLTEHAVGSSAGSSTTYEHGTGAAGPHQVTETTKTVGSTDTVTAYVYDDAGNRVSATSGGDSAGYVWDAEGELAAVGNDEYTYDASGNRLVREDASGTTVYLPGGQEIHIDGSTVTASRYYSFAGKTVATRTGGGLGAVTSLVCNGQGSVVAAVPNTVWEPDSVERVQSDPFGGVRGGTDAGVPGDHRFLGAVFDAGAGLSLLGARYYDAVIGRFISVDPQLDAGNPAQFNAYVYSGNNPLTWSDPSGLDWNSFWGDVAKNAKKVVGNVGSFINTYKAEIVGGIVGLAVGVGCTIATGGAGIVGCAILGGMAGGAVTSLMKSAETGTFSVGGLIMDTLVGGAIGGLTAGVGVVLGPLLKAGVSAAGTAIKTAFGSLVRTVTSKLKPMLSSVSQRVNSFFKPSGSVKPAGSSRPGSAQSCVVNSFVPGTLVLLADGSAKAIQDVALGDQVQAADPETGVSGARTVMALISGTGEKSLVTVTTAQGEVVATDNHPFWSVTAAAWVAAGELVAGDTLLLADGSTSVVTAVSATTAEQTVHNLTVADLHTYYVLVGDAAVLVHNCPPGTPSAGNRPPNLSPEGSGRPGAFNQAKRDADIPTSQSPDRVLPNLDRRGNPQPGRTYEFDTPAPGGGTRTASIRDDAAGHQFPDDAFQNRGPHFNTENGGHYDY